MRSARHVPPYKALRGHQGGWKPAPSAGCHALAASLLTVDRQAGEPPKHALALEREEGPWLLACLRAFSGARLPSGACARRHGTRRRAQLRRIGCYARMSRRI